MRRFISSSASFRWAIGGAVVDFEAKWLYLLALGFVVITVLGLWLRKRYAGIVERDAESEAEEA